MGMTASTFPSASPRIAPRSSRRAARKSAPLMVLSSILSSSQTGRALLGRHHGLGAARRVAESGRGDRDAPRVDRPQEQLGRRRQVDEYPLLRAQVPAEVALEARPPLAELARHSEAPVKHPAAGRGDRPLERRQPVAVVAARTRRAHPRPILPPPITLRTRRAVRREDGARTVAEAGARLPLLQRLPQDVGQKADEDVRLDPLLLLMPDRANRELALVDTKGRLDLRELDVRLPHALGRPVIGDNYF